MLRSVNIPRNDLIDLEGAVRDVLVAILQGSHHFVQLAARRQRLNEEVVGIYGEGHVNLEVLPLAGDGRFRQGTSRRHVF